MTGSHEPQTRSFSALGTTAVVAVTDPSAIAAAEDLLRRTLRAFDAACSRFRDDSEIVALARRAGTPVEVSGLLFDALSVAIEVARLTDGAVDPTVGGSLRALGYDRDFQLLDATRCTPLGHATRYPGDRLECAARPAPGWRTVILDPSTRTVTVPPGTWLDLGSSAKAFAADASAALIAGETRSGAVVSLGGDVAVAGPAPEHGWPIGIAEDCSARGEAISQVVALRQGGLATSSPGVRSWGVGGSRHHIVDPRTGASAPRYWATVSAAAPTCVEANAVTTAAVVWGANAVPRLVALGGPTRLVRHDGEVVSLNGWPSEDPSGTAVTGPSGANAFEARAGTGAR